MLATMAYIKFNRPAKIANGRSARMRIICKFNCKQRPAELANGRLAMMRIIGKFFRKNRPAKTAKGRLAMTRIIEKFIRKQGLAKIAKDRLARMPVIGMYFQRRQVQLPALDLAAELVNGRLAMLDVIDMFFQKRRGELPATMGYITPDVSAEIANGRLAMMDAIGRFFLQPHVVWEGPDRYWDPAGFWSRRTVRWRRRPRTLKHGRFSMLVVFYMTRPRPSFLGYMTQEIMRIFQRRRTVQKGHGGISLQMAAKFAAYCFCCELSASSDRRARNRRTV